MNSSADEVREKLTSHRVQIVQELRVDRTILYDHLRSKGVFDNEDCEIVQAEKTNERKASKLLDILETKGTEGLEHFLDVLQLLNPGLYEKLTGQKATASKCDLYFVSWLVSAVQLLQWRELWNRLLCSPNIYSVSGRKPYSVF